MANRLRDGFDFYGAKAEAAGVWTSLGTFNLNATTRFGVGQSVVSVNTAGNVGMSGEFGANCGTLFFTFAHMQNGAIAGATQIHHWRIYDAGTVQVSIRFMENGDIVFFRGDETTLLGTYIAAFNGSAAWAHFQIKIVFSQTVGSIEVRKNGNTVADYTVPGSGALDTCTSANEWANAIDNICDVSATEVQRYDDMWIYDNVIVAGEPSDWIGDVRAVQVMPNSDSSITLSRSAGATNFSNVDELLNSSADYVFGATAGLVDQYGNAGLSSPPQAILGVTAKAICMKMDAGPRTLGLRITSGASVVDSAGVAVGTNAQSVKHNIDLNPATALPWTSAEIAAALFGPRIVT